MSRIIRVFRATARTGSEAAFASFFVNQAVELVRRQDGMVAVQVGLPPEDRPGHFLMITTWRDLEALIGFAGENWKEAVIDPREASLISEASVEHYHEHEARQPLD